MASGLRRRRVAGGHRDPGSERGSQRAAGLGHKGRAAHEQLLSEAFGPHREARSPRNAYGPGRRPHLRHGRRSAPRAGGAGSRSRGPGRDRGAHGSRREHRVPGGRPRGRPRRRGRGGHVPRLRLRGPGSCGQGAPRRRTAHRHERGRHVPDSAGDAPWRGIVAVRRCRCRPGRADGRREAASPDGGSRACERRRRGDRGGGPGLDRRSARPPAGDPLRPRAQRCHAPRPRRLDPEPDVEAPDLASLVRVERG